VAQRDGATTRVNLSVIETQILDAVHSHRGEGLVDLVDVNVVLVQVELAQQLGDGSGRADTHNARGHTGNGRAAELG
jgi:hypothetical protein